MIVDRLVNHCEKNKVLSEDQQGFILRLTWV